MNLLAALASADTFRPVLLPSSSLSRPAFLPLEPQSLAETGLTSADIEGLILKLLLHQGSLAGRQIAHHIRLPINVTFEVLRSLKAEMLLAYRAAAPMGDFEHELTDAGVQRAQRLMKRCTFYGAAPVQLAQYVAAVEQQSIRRSRPKLVDVVNALQDLSLRDALVSQIGQALSAGRGLLLYGAPGNGKTSIAERLIKAAGDSIWIPRTITAGGEIIRLYDPANHEEVVPQGSAASGSSEKRPDLRWICIRRPTVIAGGELSLEHLDMRLDRVSGILEASLQMKSNCGALVIDDFGRQSVSNTDLLNRWIVPLEKGIDYQTLPAGRQIQVPFDQLLVFATNLPPGELLDEAFLRRIPYKVEVTGPSETEFARLVERLAGESHIACEPGAIDYLVKKHYLACRRPLRYCHARDLLMQIRYLCQLHERAPVVNEKTIDAAVHNYFAGL